MRSCIFCWSGSNPLPADLLLNSQIGRVTQAACPLQILGGDLAGTIEEADPSSRFNVGDKARPCALMIASAAWLPQTTRR